MLCSAYPAEYFICPPKSGPLAYNPRRNVRLFRLGRIVFGGRPGTSAYDPIKTNETRESAPFRPARGTQAWRVGAADTACGREARRALPRQRFLRSRCNSPGAGNRRSCRSAMRRNDSRNRVSRCERKRLLNSRRGATLFLFFRSASLHVLRRPSFSGKRP